MILIKLIQICLHLVTKDYLNVYLTVVHKTDFFISQKSFCNCMVSCIKNLTYSVIEVYIFAFVSCFLRVEIAWKTYPYVAEFQDSKRCRYAVQKLQWS